MSQPPPGSPTSTQFTRFLIGFALVEGALFAAILVAMALDVITSEQMTQLLVAVAVVGGGVLSWRLLNAKNQADRERQTPHRRPGGARTRPGTETSSPGTTATGLDRLGKKDPMAKFRDPNQ